MVGASYSEQDYTFVSYSKLSGFTLSENQNLLTHNPETTAVFGSINWKVTHQFEVSVEARHQADKVVEVSERRVRRNSSFYLSYVQGINRGQFNAGLVNLSQGELEQISAQTTCGVVLTVPEEEIENFELGARTGFWDGRGQMSAAVYFADWSSIPSADIASYIPVGEVDPVIVQVNASGGQADLSVLELESSLLAGDHWMLEATLSITESKIGSFVSSDAAVLLGDSAGALGNEFSRYPETAGTLSVTYSNDLSNNLGWYARGDYIYRGSTWMTNGKITETGDSSTFNLRLGHEGEQ